MPIPAFPTYLPKVKMSQYGLDPKSNVLSTDINGPVVKRRRSVNSPTEVSVTWSLNSTQLALFQYFFEVSANYGASWFTIPLVNGAGESVVTARFKGSYAAATESREYLWNVTATLEVLSMPHIA